MKRAARFAALLALVPSAARAGVAQTGAAVLRLPLSAQVAAMGGAYTAIGGGVSSIGVNPAGVSAAPSPEITSTFHSGVLSDAFGFLGYAHPLKFATPFAGVSYYNTGQLNLVTSGGAQSTVVAEQDYVGMVGLSMPLGLGLSVGVLGEAYRLQLAQEATAEGFAGSAGVQWATPVTGLRLGAALQNAGPSVKFESASDPLPLTARVGAAYTYDNLPDAATTTYYTGSHLTFSADGVQVRGDAPYGAVGTEFRIDIGASGSVAVRVGWTFDYQAAAGISYGIGLREHGFTVDYTQAEAGELGNVQYVTLGYRF